MKHDRRIGDDLAMAFAYRRERRGCAQESIFGRHRSNLVSSTKAEYRSASGRPSGCGTGRNVPLTRDNTEVHAASSKKPNLINPSLSVSLSLSLYLKISVLNLEPPALRPTEAKPRQKRSVRKTPRTARAANHLLLTINLISSPWR